MAEDDVKLAQPVEVRVVNEKIPVDPGAVQVNLRRSAAASTLDQPLWSAIRNRTEAISFNRYAEFIDRLLCCPQDGKEDKGSSTCGTPGDCASTPAFRNDYNDYSETSSRGLRASDVGAPSIHDRMFDLSIRPSIYGVDAYQLLRIATEVFLIFESGVVISPPRKPYTGVLEPMPNRTLEEEAARLGGSVTFQDLSSGLTDYLSLGEGKLPYLKRIVDALLGLDPARRAEKLPYCEAVLRNRFSCPSLLELIWSYWHEEGMLVQTLNAIALRFQNRRSGPRDPLANLEIDPLRPLNNLFWGFIQDEYHRLSVPRRAYEYDHHYGLTLYGKAVPALRSADSRSKFLEAFHNLLHRAAVFYQEDADTTVISDGFPLLNALREVHLLLAEGAHNQFGDLPWTARAEMLIMEWLLARPEIRDFLRGRAMVPYREPWMGQVDTMKRLQGWTDTTITHFRDLGVFGEQILLSVRYGDWIDVNDQEQARNWARYWKPEIQTYIHAYTTATGVDLTAAITDTRRAADRYVQPSVHLRNRLLAQQRQGRLPASTAAATRTLTSEVMEYEQLPALRRNRLLRYREDD